MGDITTPILQNPMRPLLTPMATLDPFDIGFDAWWDFADLSTITESAGFVSQVVDKMGNGLDITQGVGSNQPQTGVSSQNGLNALLFSGNQWLSAGMPAALVYGQGDFTIFGAFKKTTGSNRDTIYAYGSNNAGGIRYELLIHDSKPRAQMDDDNTKEETDSGVNVQDIWATAASVRRGNVLEVWVNGVLENTHTMPGGFSVTPNGPADVGAILNNGGPNHNEFLNGDVGEVMVVGRSFSQGLMQQLHQYAKEKWGI